MYMNFVFDECCTVMLIQLQNFYHIYPPNDDENRDIDIRFKYLYFKWRAKRERERKKNETNTNQWKFAMCFINIWIYYSREIVSFALEIH